MKHIFKNLNNKVLFWLVGVFSVITFLWFSSYVRWEWDLLDEIMKPSRDLDVTLSQTTTIKDIWEEVLEDNDSVLVKVTKILLWLTITLSVTMILYNWVQYIIQTWQWKEWKDLTKNIAYIIAWIIIALFSTIIITIIQSSVNDFKDISGTPTELVD